MNFEPTEGLLSMWPTAVKATRTHTLEQAVDIAASRFIKNTQAQPDLNMIRFNVQNPLTEPLLTVVDYFLIGQFSGFLKRVKTGFIVSLKIRLVL